MKRPSLLEFILAITLLLLVCCVGLIVVCWIILHPEVKTGPAALSGTMVITDGAIFSDELNNPSSPQFKALAFDIQQLVWEAFHHGNPNSHFRWCQVTHFGQGSVVVTFNLKFDKLIDPVEVQEQLSTGLQDSRGLVFNKESINITASCHPHHAPCPDQLMCISTDRFCDGVEDCLGGSDEDATRCATPCDGQFLLHGPSGYFSSSNQLEMYNSRFCRWIIRVERDSSIQIDFLSFDTEENQDQLRLYEGVASNKKLTAELSGSIPPGTVWLLSDQSTIEFSSDDVNNLSGFSATYRTINLSSLSNKEKVACTFEHGMCFWRQQLDDDADWILMHGPAFPLLTGPSIDHTLGNQSGFYLVTPFSPGQWLKSFRIQSLPLDPSTQPMCLHFWYHMFGEDVHSLRVLLFQMSYVTLAFQKVGNFGDNWNYGQVTLDLTAETTVVFEALKNTGMQNDIALDDITLTDQPCGPAPPDPTNVLPPTPPPLLPADCGGPFELWEPNSTFTSPNYPHSYGTNARCVWILNTKPGQNIQLHLLDLDIESTFDVLEVRDGAGPNSTILVVLTGDDVPPGDFFSSANEMTVRFFTDESGYRRGFRANFTSGVNLGSPVSCADSHFQCQTGECIHGKRQCDGVADCPDASDEANCVILQGEGSGRLHIQVNSLLLSVCSDGWNSQLSSFTCQYLGYRSGEASSLPALPEESLFAIFRITSNNGTLETSISETCISKRVISLNCDNHPCGVRFAINDTAGEKQSKSHGDVKVVGGVDTEKGAWPWMVSLHWKGHHCCGASVLNSDWLLTAAHCVYGKNLHTQWWTAKFGLHAQNEASSSQVQIRHIDQIIINGQYDRLTKQADIAMIHLQHPINFTDFVQPVCLPEAGQQVIAGKMCFIAGWGRDAEGGSYPNILQEAQVPLLPNAQCQRELPEYVITSSMVCAGYPWGGVDSCQGDSGGPLMCLDDGYWTLIGVTSFGVGCGQPKRPGVYAHVSSFINWISQMRRSSLNMSWWS